jgi:hypothetical protein
MGLNIVLRTTRFSTASISFDSDLFGSIGER